MSRGPRLKELKLTARESNQLLEWTRRHKTSQALAQRARIILACAQGLDNSEVSRGCRVMRQTVGKWRSRFLERRLDGLLDEPRPGAPRKLDDARIEQLIATTLNERPRGATHWSTRLLSRGAGHRLRARDRRSASASSQQGVLGVPAHDRGQRPRALDVHLILDNYGTHKTPSVKGWFARHPRFHVHFTPTSGSWLNLVERWFALISARQIKRGTHRSTLELERAIRQYLDICNEDPKPFVWAKSADEILASVARFCKRISDSGH